MKLFKLCAWCSKVIKPGFIDVEKISHGICLECKEKLLRDWKPGPEKETILG